jgi:hypothetical protein
VMIFYIFILIEFFCLSSCKCIGNLRLMQDLFRYFSLDLVFVHLVD